MEQGHWVWYGSRGKKSPAPSSQITPQNHGSLTSFQPAESRIPGSTRILGSTRISGTVSGEGQRHQLDQGQKGWIFLCQAGLGVMPPSIAVACVPHSISDRLWWGHQATHGGKTPGRSCPSCYQNQDPKPGHYPCCRRDAVQGKSTGISDRNEGWIWGL